LWPAAAPKAKRGSASGKGLPRGTGNKCPHAPETLPILPS
jgi:hypothetical protein